MAATNTAAPATGSVTRLRAVVHGHVQGVGYRYWAHHMASRFSGVVGTVKNLSDGTVEIEAEAPEKALLQAVFTELHVGPAAAQVTSVEPTWEEGVAPRFIEGGAGLRVL